MLGTEHDSVAVNEGDEDDRDLNGRETVKVEGLAGEVVQPFDRQASLLPDLADRSVLGTLVRLDATMYDFPRAGATRSLGAPQDECTQACRAVAKYEDVNDTDQEFRHMSVSWLLIAARW